MKFTQMALAWYDSLDESEKENLTKSFIQLQKLEKSYKLTDTDITALYEEKLLDGSIHRVDRVMPVYNCSNCKHFTKSNKEILESKENGYYAMECKNFAHPISDCVLRGFEGHSSQPGFSQSINKESIENSKNSTAENSNGDELYNYTTGVSIFHSSITAILLTVSILAKEFEVFKYILTIFLYLLISLYMIFKSTKYSQNTYNIISLVYLSIAVINLFILLQNIYTNITTISIAYVFYLWYNISIAYYFIQNKSSFNIKI